MRKFNKILMMTVAILLTFVLISGCILSGTMARFAISKDATTAATLQRFGAEVTVEVVTANLPTGATVDTTTTSVLSGKTIACTVNGLKIAPGETLADIIHINLNGTANVNCRLTMDVVTIFGDTDTKNSFYIPNGVGVSSGKTYLPIRILCDKVNDKAASTSVSINCYTPWNAGATSDALSNAGEVTTQGKVSSTVCKILAQKFDVTCDNVESDGYTATSANTKYVYKDFVVDDKIALYNTSGYSNENVDKSDSNKVNDLYFSLDYALDFSKSGMTQDQCDEMMTYLSYEREPKFSISFLVTIEQT